MSNNYGLAVKFGPSLGISARNWAKMILINGLISLKRMPRAFFTQFASIVGSPFRMYEKLKFDKQIKNFNLKKPSIFILGHWRSGTTYLHNILCQDNQFGFITMLQAAFPNSFMTFKIFRSFMKRFLPKNRPMDNVSRGITLPQEDEMTLSNLYPYSFYNAFYFPKKLRLLFLRFAKFENVAIKIKERWQKIYQYLLKKASYYMSDKQLMLKNPVNTARVKLLLNMFPKAKFIHIYRNPYIVFASTLNFYEKAIKPFALQDIPRPLLEKNIFWIYKTMMESYFKEKSLIPKENLVEIKFEDLEANPMEQVKYIYDGLNLDGYSRVKFKILRYIEKLKEYKKNMYYFTEEMINKVKINWKFAIRKWKYDPLITTY